jgi:hypothetical protein
VGRRLRPGGVQGRVRANGGSAGEVINRALSGEQIVRAAV